MDSFLAVRGQFWLPVVDASFLLSELVLLVVLVVFGLVGVVWEV
jgi:hypothetical protein